MADDTTALQERIARVLHKADPISGHGHDWAKLTNAERRFYMHKAAAVLPIIARVRRDAAREALDGLATNMIRIADETPDSLTRTAATITARMAGEYKSNAYPEETP